MCLCGVSMPSIKLSTGYQHAENEHDFAPKKQKNGCSRNFCQTGGRMIKKWKSYACCPKLLVKSASLPTIPAMIREIRVRHNVTNALWLFLISMGCILSFRVCRSTRLTRLLQWCDFLGIGCGFYILWLFFGGISVEAALFINIWNTNTQQSYFGIIL